MSEEFLAHIFEPFTRAESVTKSGVKGSGLGMAITKSLVELMNGTITVESEIDVGTTVKREFKNRISEPVSTKLVASGNTASKIEGKKILLVEDNDMNREITEEILTECGASVDTAEDGDIAVEKIKTAVPGQYDFILMDVQMPRMNGYDATKAIRSLKNEKLASILIIALSANAFEEDIQKSLAVGMDAHITKPIDIEKMKKTIAEVIPR